MKGHIESLLKVLEDQKRENQALSEGLALRGIWQALLEPASGEVPLDSSFVGGSSVSGYGYANALTWISAGSFIVCIDILCIT